MTFVARWSLMTVALFLSVVLVVHAWAQENEPSQSLTLIYKVGQTRLSDNQKEVVRAFANRLRNEGDIEQIHVMAWSDLPMPAQGSSLPEESEELAEERADRVEDYLEEVASVSEVDTYNMAENSGWLARLLGTEGAELKSNFSRRPDQGFKEPDLQVLQRDGLPSRVILIAEMGFNPVPAETPRVTDDIQGEGQGVFTPSTE